MTRETEGSQSTLVEVKLAQVGNYKFTGKMLGKGSFAVVKEAIHSHLKVHVSVKVIDLRKCNTYMLKNYLREAAILKNLKHPNIIQIFEAIQYNNMYYLVSELIKGGDLCAYVQQKKGKVEENITRRFSRQIASALKYLHTREIVHRDLKLENVMLDSSKKNIKLIDFGLTNTWSAASPLKTLCGSPEYSAPELFVPGTVYGPEVDMWALGVIMFAMAAGRLPFPCLSTIMKTPEKKSQFLKTINDGLSEEQTRLIKSYSPEFTDLIRGLMNPKWEYRLTIDGVFSDPWLTNKYRWADVPYEPIEISNRDKIIRQLSLKFKTTPVKMEAELKAVPFGEAGGFYNIMTYIEVQERCKKIPSIKSKSSENGLQSNMCSLCPSAKKRSCKQISEGPIKMSLPGTAMKLNEVSFSSSPVQQQFSSPKSRTSSETSSKPDNYLGKPIKMVLPKVKSFKSNYSGPFTRSQKSECTIQNKLPYVGAPKRKVTIGKTI